MRLYGRILAVVAALGVVLLPGVASAGTGWVTQLTVDPAGNSEGSVNTLESVSCTSASSCIAVGTFGTGSLVTSNPTTTLAESWDGSSWQQQATPNPVTTASDTGELRGVKCVSGTFCMAVGQYMNSAGVMQTLAEKWNGTAWSIVPTPNPAGAPTSQLNALACTTTANCIAVGYYQNSGGTNLPLAMRWNGTSWALQSVLATTGGRLRGVSCTSASACTAVGFAGPNGLADRWNGSSWKTQSVPRPSGTGSVQLNGVKCSSTTICTAIGSFGTSPLAERWNGTAWKTQYVPLLANSVPDSLAAISCVSASNCTAVGNAWCSSITSGCPDIQVTLAEVWNGTSWVAQPTPNGRETFNSLLSLACTTGTACIAVGEGQADDGPMGSSTLAMQRT
jgi:hypothetical protein